LSSRLRTGRTPSRADWRMMRDVFVAEKEAEAWRLSVGGWCAA
jgi:alkanesulfonate monooxygenase SsuD/methylene tetrahydromethanopterin reductase-like flavin-dependent oxidoreductase (luciferase family)